MIIHYIKYQFSSLVRQFYWLYRLSNVNFGKGRILSFPILVEGGGNIQFGDNSKLQKRVKLGIAKSAMLVVGNSSNFEANSSVLIGSNAKLEIGHDFKLGANARLIINGKWIFGDSVKIETNCSIFAREAENTGDLIIGNNSNIGDYTIIDLVDDVIIGNDVAIGPNCTLYTHDHLYSDKTLPAWKGGLISKPITIEDGAWIGSGVTLLPGITIGKRAVIAAGSVVTKSVETNTIFGGVPAKFIKEI